MTDRFRDLAGQSSVTDAAIALRVASSLLAVLDQLLLEWGSDDPQGKRGCRSDRASMARAVQILEWHYQVQDLLARGRDQGTGSEE